MEQLNRLIHGKSGHAGFNIGNPGGHCRVQAIQIKGDIDRPARQHLPRLGDNIRRPALTVFRHGDNIVPVFIGRCQPVEGTGMATETDLHRMRRVNLPLIRQIGPPVCRRFLGPEKMINGGEHIGMGIEVEKADRLTPRQLAPAKRLNNTASDRMVAADGYRPGPRRINILIKGGDLFDAVFIVVAPGESDITGINNLCLLPRVQLKAAMHPALQGGDIAHRPRPQMLVPLGGTVAGGMRHANERDIRALRVLMRASEKRRDPPPVEVVHHAVIVFFGHGFVVSCYCYAEIRSCFTKPGALLFRFCPEAFSCVP